MSRENVDTKGRRYLTEARVIVVEVVGDRVDARVRGDGEIYRVRHLARTWICTCPARTRCAHVVAVALVTAPGRPG